MYNYHLLFSQILQIYFSDILCMQCHLQNYGHVKDITSLVIRFVSLLQSYISREPQRAMKYLQKHAQALQ